MRCAKQRKCAAWHLFTFGRNKKCVSFLITDKKLITVPWNYAAKLDEMNRIIQQGGGTKKYDFKSYINEMWNECMENTDAHLKVADKPAKRGK